MKKVIIITKNRLPYKALSVFAYADPLATLEEYYSLTTGKELFENSSFDSGDFEDNKPFNWKGKCGEVFAATILTLE